MPFQVLVVDDAAFVRDTIKRNLRSLIPDAEIYDAPDGRRACSIVKGKGKNIKLILSDWEMPEMSGEEFLKWLRSQEEHQKTPFIMVTSRGDKEHVVTAVKAGVNDYITKPFTPDELQKKVAKQLKRMGYKGMKETKQSGGAFSSLDVLTGGGNKPKPKGPAQVTAAAGFGKPAAKPANTAKAPIDLVDAGGEPLAEVNAYVHGLTAQQGNPNASHVMVNIRFVDNDPEKFEALSKAIAR